MKLGLHPHTLKLARPFTISRGTHERQRTLVVSLEADGHIGFGEAVESDYYAATLESMTALLEAWRPAVEAGAGETPEQLWNDLGLQLSANSFAAAALDGAVHDLWGKRRGEPVWRLWGLRPDRLPPSSFTITIDTPDEMAAQLEAQPGWPVYKVKLGTSRDVQLVRHLRTLTGALLRVDANCAWSEEEAVENALHFSELGVELIEQPLAPDNWTGCRRLRDESAVPLFADESCRGPDDVARCEQSFDGINIKLVKCGGLLPARQMIDEARGRGLRVMIGCMTESSVGISAAAQLLPLVDYADLDGPLLLESDIARGALIDEGQVSLPPGGGCGVELL